MPRLETPSRLTPQHTFEARSRIWSAVSASATVLHATIPAIALAATTLLLGGCETTESATTLPPERSAVAIAPRRTMSPVEIAPHVVDGVWSFHSGEASCTASAVHPTLALTVAVQDGHTVDIALRPGARNRTVRRPDGMYLVFSGLTGSWRARGRMGRDHTVALTQLLNEGAAGQLMLLLEGGTIEIGGPRTSRPVLRLPPSGPAGRGWFECVRRQLLS